jgi:hypothetical protein
MKQYRHYLLALWFVAIALFAQAQELTKSQLMEDLMYFKDTLPVKHKNLFDKISKADFDQKVFQIAAKLDSLDTETFFNELYRLNVDIGDEHTRITPVLKKTLPIRFEKFSDGIFVTGIDAPYEHLLLSKLVAINGYPMEALDKKCREVIRQDNQAYFDMYLLRYLGNPFFLKGIGVLPTAEAAVFTLQSAKHGLQKVTLRAVARETFTLQWAHQYADFLPYTNREKSYWYQYDSLSSTLYFNYAHCRNDEKKPFPQFNEALFATIERVQPRKLVVDLRFNDGGNSAILDPFFERLHKSYLNKKGHLFVLIGRLTFSSAVMNAIYFTRKTKAILVGEMTGGNINHYGEVRGFRLPHSRAEIAYSTRYWENWKGKKGALLPDIPIQYHSQNFMQNKDEALEYINQQ